MSLPRYHKKKLAPEGRRAERKRPVRRLSYARVSKRAQGRCEMPDPNGVDGCCNRPQDPLDPHHVYGRGHLPGIPEDVCEDPALILGACRRCHDRIHDGDVELGDAARLKAAGWYAEARGLPFRPVGDPVDVMRELVRLEEAA